MEVNESLNIIKKEVAHRYTDQNPGTSGLRKKVNFINQRSNISNKKIILKISSNLSLILIQKKNIKANL